MFVQTKTGNLRSIHSFELSPCFHPRALQSQTYLLTDPQQVFPSPHPSLIVLFARQLAKMNNFYANVQNPENFVLDFWVFRQNTGVIVNMYSQKKLITSTCSNRNIYSLVRISQEIITPGSRFLLENEYCLGKKCSLNLLVNRKEQGIVMLKHLNGLLCVQFNCPK